MTISSSQPVLITGAAGSVGSVGRQAVENLLAAGIPVRAMVRIEDERAAGLRALGADVVVADMRKPDEVYRAMDGCRRVGLITSVGPVGHQLLRMGN